MREIKWGLVVLGMLFLIGALAFAIDREASARGKSGFSLNSSVSFPVDI